jgi:cytochrome c oxidase subunit II
MSRFWFQPPQTAVAQRISDLHVTLLWIVAAIVVIVFGLMIYSLWRHRKSVGAVPAQFAGNRKFELIWTVIPIFIVVGMAWPATSAVLFMKDTSHADMVIKITGYQWKWHYEYLTEGIAYYSQLSTPRAQIENLEPKGENYLLEVDNPLVVPVGKKVRILVTANDVIHSWWVPAFGVKQDGIPGFIKESWFRVDTPGIYRGQCAELCGKDHGFMPIVVHALPQEEYAAWVASKVAAAAPQAVALKDYSTDELKDAGGKIYAAKCVGCHQPNGQGLPPAFPALAHGKVATGPLAGAVDIVMNGSKANPAMIAWKSQLSDTELAEVVTYVRNDFGNSTGDAVQPKDIAAARH